MAFLAPTRRKLAIAAALFLVYPVALAMRVIPPAWDVLDLRELGGVLIGVGLGLPIRAFDALTGSAFAARSEGFLAFPSGTQLFAALAFDFLAFYLIASVWTRYRPARVERQSAARP